MDKSRMISAAGRPTWTRKFALFPKTTLSKKTVWLKHYWEYRRYFDLSGRAPMKGLYWINLYTEQEYTLKVLQGKI